ncbi:MAG: carboxypeptidase M32 [Chitinophagales bacterium]|nr:carboxypeptidase M32 [Chitinophagales bacterium]
MNAYHQYCEWQQKIADVHNAIAVLSWDQETYLPEKGAKHRSQQIATLSGIAHEIATAPTWGELLHDLQNNSHLSEWERCNVIKTADDYERQSKFTTDFVMRESKAIADAYHAWMHARQANDFKVFAPALTTIVDIKRETCHIMGYDEHPYDALLHEYEPQGKTSVITPLFESVRSQLVDFVQQIAQQPQVEDSFLYDHYHKDAQWEFGLELLEQMGYDFQAGRQDKSTHPFTTSFSPLDVRVTTRVNEHDLNEMTWSCLHEGGHALYEQGLKPEYYGLPTGKAASLGIHESQSRLWENNVGRSLPYWKANFKRLRGIFRKQLKNVGYFQFYKAINKVEPSLIRTSADELTYHFHILIRFEIEKALIEGKIEVKDLAEIWNAKYREYLGIDVPDDKHGVLQDIHWSHGSFGYFPTYSLGSFYAAQFFAAAQRSIPDLNSQIEAGKLGELLAWLRTNIHQYGMLYTSEELCQKVTGEPLNFDYFMQYAREKYGAIYGL